MQPKTEIINLSSWKGKDDVLMTERKHSYSVIEHRKNKETGTVTESIHVIPAANVRTLYAIICRLCTPYEAYGYRYLVRALIASKDIAIAEGMTVEQMMNAFNGGRFRNKYYFPFYYYPMKILEAKNRVQHLGRGGVILLKEN